MKTLYYLINEFKNINENDRILVKNGISLILALPDSNILNLPKDNNYGYVSPQKITQ